MGAMRRPPATRMAPKPMTASVMTRSMARRAPGLKRSTTRCIRKWRRRRTATAAPRKMIQTKQSRATSSYHLKVACITYRLNTPRNTSPTRTTMRARQTRSTSMSLGRGSSLRHHLVEELLAHLGLEELPHRLRPLLELAEILHLVDLDALGFHRGEGLGFLLELVLPVLGTRRQHGLVDDLLEVAGQRIVLGAGHGPDARRVGMPGDRVVLGDLVELVRRHGGRRQLETIDRALLHGQVHLAPLHRHRVGPEGFHGLYERRHGRNADGLTLEVGWCEDGALVREDIPEAPAATEAEALRAQRLEPLDQLLADGPVDHLPDLLTALKEERHVGHQELRVPFRPDRRRIVGPDVDCPELHAFQHDRPVLGELARGIDLDPEPTSALRLGNLLELHGRRGEWMLDPDDGGELERDGSLSRSRPRHESRTRERESNSAEPEQDEESSGSDHGGVSLARGRLKRLASRRDAATPGGDGQTAGCLLGEASARLGAREFPACVAAVPVKQWGRRRLPRFPHIEENPWPSTFPAPEIGSASRSSSTSQAAAPRAPRCATPACP